MKKVVLAYSGGLDTSCAVRWLKDRYGLAVICFSAFIGEAKSRSALLKRAKAAGASKSYILDLKNEFAEDFILPSLWAHGRYEGGYPLATALGRPLIAKHLVRIAEKEGADYVAHGCTGKGNDQVRIEVGVRTLNPRLKIIAPLREWEFTTREEEMDYASANRIPVEATKKSPYSLDKNIWGISIEGGKLEDPMTEPPEEAYVMTEALSKVSSKPKYIELEFAAGVPIRLNGIKKSLVGIIESLNALAGSYGIGRFDQIENRLVGIKSREIYEAPAAEVLIKAHTELEGLVMDREFSHYKAVLSHRYAELVYYGQWFSPLKNAMDAFFASNQDRVTGKVRMKFEKGNAICVGRQSPYSLYSKSLATYSEGDMFDRKMAEGFLKIWGLPYEGLAKKVLKKKS